MRLFREVLVLLGLVLAAAAGTHLFHPRAPAWHEVEEPFRDDEVTLGNLVRAWGNDVLWIDARPRPRYEKAHIPGAINISEQELEEQMIEHIAVLQDNRKPVVIYCDSGACQASRKLKDYLAPRFPAGEFFVLRGGWQSWEETHAGQAARGGAPAGK